MKLTISLASRMQEMIDGKQIPESQMRGPLTSRLLEEGIFEKIMLGRRRALIGLHKPEQLRKYLRNHLGINDLDSYILALRNADLSRSDAILASSDSKLKKVRTFKGFLINSLGAVDAIYNNAPIRIQPTEGMFTFLYDYENFIPGPEFTIVGIENPENFRHIQKQKDLFKNIQPLFMCRYPYSGDLVKWLQSIPNSYLHFGDFDFSGISIYVNEYKRKLGEKAGFFIPDGLEDHLRKSGNKALYDKQAHQIPEIPAGETALRALVALLHKHKKCLEQEYFIDWG